MTTKVVGSTSEGLIQYVDSVAELEALPSPTSGQEAIVQGVPFLYEDSNWIPSLGYVTPECYGAVGNAKDGNTDDIEALEDMVSSGYPFKLISGYAISRKLVINPVPESIGGDGYIYFTGSGETAVELGEATSNTTVKGKIRIYVERDSEDETDQNAGIEVINVFSSFLDLDSRSFYKGIKLAADDGVVAYNTIVVNRVQDSIISMEFAALGSTGYVNQNTIIGGRLGNATSSANDLKGVLYTNDSGAGINGNVFYNTSFEINNSGAGSSICFFGQSTTGEPDAGANTMFIGGRIEGPEYLIGGSVILSNNSFDFARAGYSETVAKDFIQPGSSLDLINNRFGLSNRTLVSNQGIKIASYNRQDVVQNTPGGTSYITAPSDGAFWWEDIFYNARPDSLGLGETIKSISADGFMGMLFDLSNIGHDFHRRIDLRVLNRNPGARVGIVCWDSGGNKLTGAGDCSHPFNATNGYFRTGQDLSVERGEVGVAFGPNVAYAFVGVVVGSAEADYYGVDYFVRGDSNIRQVTDTATYATLETATDLRLGTDKTPLSDIQPDAVTGDQEGAFCRKGDAVSTDPLGWYRTAAAWIPGPALP